MKEPNKYTYYIYSNLLYYRPWKNIIYYNLEKYYIRMISYVYIVEVTNLAGCVRLRIDKFGQPHGTFITFIFIIIYKFGNVNVYI